jgi:hypothetical protein
MSDESSNLHAKIGRAEETLLCLKRDPSLHLPSAGRLGMTILLTGKKEAVVEILRRMPARTQARLRLRMTMVL